MEQEVLVFEGKKFISSRRASQLSGYTLDYIGQLSRVGKIESQMVGRTRFVGESSLLTYLHLSNGSNGGKNGRNFEKQKTEKSAEKEISKKDQNIGPKIFQAISFSFTILLIGLILSQPIVKQGANDFLVNLSVGKFLNQGLVNTSRPDEMFKNNTLLSINNGLLKLDQTLFYYFDKSEETLWKGFIYVRGKVLAWLTGVDSYFSRLAGREETKTIIVQSDLPPGFSSASEGVSESPAPIHAGLDEIEIRRIVRQVMLDEADVFVPTGSPGGVVAIPSTGSAQGDEALKRKIRSAFSDEVEITFDESKTAGVLRPVFRDSDTLGENYLFVLVPVN